MFGEILQVFAEKSPITVMVHGLLARLLQAEKIDAFFETVREIQYTKKILFSSLLGIMLQVVCRVLRSVHIAYLNSDLEASRIALYAKLQNLEPKTVRELLRYSALDSASIIKEMKATNPPLLSGYRTRFIDGNGLEATAHRLKVLRNTKAGALPGKSLVLFDQELGLAVDVIPCEDGHAQERSLLAPVLETVVANALLVADRNFGVRSFLFGSAAKGGFFVIRQHRRTPFKPWSHPEFKCHTATGKVFEETVLLWSEGREMKVRRIWVKLNRPTRHGESEMALCCNLPVATTAGQITEIYQARWGIETACQKLEKYLNSDINTLGYPKAALFGFGVALVAFNLYAVVMAAIRAAFPAKNINAEVSDYSIAAEIATTLGGMLLIVPETEWDLFTKGSLSQVGQALLYLASQLQLRKFKTHKRRPKKPPLPKLAYQGKLHVSTAKLLAGTG